MTNYPVQVHFLRTPQMGALKGMIIPQTLGFPDKASAEKWIRAVEAHDEIANVIVKEG